MGVRIVTVVSRLPVVVTVVLGVAPIDEDEALSILDVLCQVLGEQVAVGLAEGGSGHHVNGAVLGDVVGILVPGFRAGSVVLVVARDSLLVSVVADAVDNCSGASHLDLSC
jgi:hypothetical protein